MNHYEALELQPTATPEEVRHAWKRLSAVHHTDKATGNRERFEAARAAFEVLRDPQKRQAYDLELQGKDPVAEMLPKLAPHLGNMRAAAQKRDYWDLAASTAGLVGEVLDGVQRLKKKTP